MISDLSDYHASAHNRRPARAVGTSKDPERSGWELLAWAILQQAVDDLKIFARYGIVTKRGKCLPWPHETKPIRKWGPNGKWATYFHRVPRSIASSHGPNDHKELVAWFKSDAAQQFCDLIGCRLPASEIFSTTIKKHGGLTK